MEIVNQFVRFRRRAVGGRKWRSEGLPCVVQRGWSAIGKIRETYHRIATSEATDGHIDTL